MNSKNTISLVKFKNEKLRISAKEDMPSYMVFKNGSYYSNIRDKRNWRKIHQVPLGKDKWKAVKELGRVQEDIENGIDPSATRRRIKDLRLRGEKTDRIVGILKTHIYPFFGDYRLKEIDKGLIEAYIESRFGLHKSGKLQGVKSTLDKELNALQSLLKTADPHYKKPSLEYIKIKRKKLEPLTEDQIAMVGDSLMAKYRPVYWLMVYTGMDVSDAVYIQAKHFTKDGWIDKPRGKVEHEEGERIVLPVLPELRERLRNTPTPLDPEARLFPGINNKQTTTALLRAFKVAGLPGYGAKYLRRYIGAALLDEGYSEAWIGKALSHADGSKITGRYTQVYKETMLKAFKKLEQRGKNVGKALSENE